MDAKLMVATEGGNVKKLKDLQEEQDAMAATSKKPSNEDESPTASINPLLLASAREGSWEALNALLERADAQAQHPPMEILPTHEYLELLASGSSAQGRVAARDVEEGVDHHPAASLAAGALLKGVTPDGDTALHAVARSPKGGQHFLKFAGIIYDRDRALLFEKNHKGDTPLHCAAQAGNFQMVSHLIDLAGREGADRKLELLRMENKRHETALHEAVRIEHGRLLDHIKDRRALFDADGPPEERLRAFVDQQEKRTLVKLLMGADPELANYPKDGISPLYLAILLEKSTIALTLYCKSDGNLSYSGGDGQNALHVALLRDPDTGTTKCIYF
jgi:ankyrin repeat protein